MMIFMLAAAMTIAMLIATVFGPASGSRHVSASTTRTTA